MNGLKINDIDLHAYNFYATSDDRSPEFEDKTYDFAERDGAIFISRKMKKRLIKIEGYTYGDEKELSGTVSVVNGSLMITGSGTIFKSELAVGNNIIIDGYTKRIAKIESDTVLYTDSGFSVSKSGLKYKITAYSDCLNNSDMINKLIIEAKKITFPDTEKSIYVSIASKPFTSSVYSGGAFAATAQKITMQFVAYDPYFYSKDWGKDAAVFGTQKINTEASTQLISPYKIEDKIKADLEGITVLNVLENGSFEKDSDNDGLADGWAKVISTNVCNLSTLSVFGSRAQSVELTGTSGTEYVWIRNTKLLERGKKYFVLAYLNTGTSTTAPKNASVGIGRINAVNPSKANINKGIYEKLYFTKTTESDYDNYVHLLIGERLQEGIYGKFLADGIMAVELNSLGELPLSIKCFFNNAYATWESLGTLSSITAIDGRTQTGDDWLSEFLPFVNTLKTPGYEYDKEESSILIKNKKENLFDFNEIILDNSTVFKTFIFENKKILHLKNGTEGALTSFYFPVYLKKGITYTYKAKMKQNFSSSMYIYKYNNRFTETAFWLADSKEFSDVIKPFTVSESTVYYIHISYQAGAITNGKIEIEDLQLYEGNEINEYLENKAEILSVNTNLFNMYGVSDKLFFDDGLKKLKMWEKIIIDSSKIQTVETLSTVYRIRFLYTLGVFSGSTNSLAIGENGRIIQRAYSYTTDFVHHYCESNLIVVFIEKTKIDAMAGASTLEKAQNYFDTYPHTVIYQLATPVIEDVKYSGELNLYPGDNHIIMPDGLFMNIEGPKKYVKG